MMRPVAPAAAPDSPALDGGAELSARVDLAQSSFQAGAISADAQAAAQAKPGAVSPAQMAQLRKVSQDFESVFLSYLMKLGRDTTSKGTFWGHSQGEEIFTEMRNDELAKHMARAGGIGLSKLLVEQLTRTLQEQAVRQAAAAGPTQS